MAKKSVIERNKKRQRIVSKYSAKREELVKNMRDKSLTMKERFEFGLKVAQLPLNSAKIRERNRCFITGRARGYHRRFGISRIMMRELGLKGQIPGLTKSSW